MIYFATYKGKNHAQSEDAVLVGEKVYSDTEMILPLPDNGLICVADGVGGNQGGSTASQYVLNEMGKRHVSENDLLILLRQINDDLLAIGKIEPYLSTMATTLTGIKLLNNRILLMHVGNSRAYVLQGKYLKQITLDHTVYQWYLSNGKFEEAECCNKNEITNCFGGGNSQLLSRLLIKERSACKKLMLTSDGIHEFVKLDDLEEILNTDADGLEKCRQIVSAAISAGSNDDLTVLLVETEEK